MTAGRTVASATAIPTSCRRRHHHVGYATGNWVDFPARIRALDDRVDGTPKGTRCGDIILVADTATGYNIVHEGDAYPGWHGGPSKADSMVPLAIASEALAVESGNEKLREVIQKSQAEVGIARNQDTTKVILNLLEMVK